MAKEIILPVADNPDDVELNLRALKRNKIFNDAMIAPDGAEALDYLFVQGKYRGRDLRVMP